MPRAKKLKPEPLPPTKVKEAKPPKREFQELTKLQLTQVAISLMRMADNMEKRANDLPSAWVDRDVRIDTIREKVEEYRELADAFESAVSGGLKMEVPKGAKAMPEPNGQETWEPVKLGMIQ